MSSRKGPTYCDRMNLKRKLSLRPSTLKKRNCELYLNPVYSDENFVNCVSSALKGIEDKILVNGAKVGVMPFPHCVLPNFLIPFDDVEHLAITIQDLTFKEKQNDLYKLSQTGDFKGIEDPGIRSVKKFLGNRFLAWLGEVTGYVLNSEVDISAACYSTNDYLLCHNDQFDDRKIAFVYYLVDEDWSEEDGGLFELFNTKEYKVPDSVVSSLVPRKNTMLFFPVSASSFHQVSEVLSEKKRYSISGWYHSEVIEVEDELQMALITSLPLNHPGSLSDFISPFYLEAAHMQTLRRQFELKSEMLLFSFLKDVELHAQSSIFSTFHLESKDIVMKKKKKSEKQKADVYRTVSRELDQCSNWTLAGPPDIRSFLEIKTADLPPMAKNLYEFLHSETFLLYLSRLVSLNLTNADSVSSGTPTSSASQACYTAVLAKMGHRSYTLLNSTEENLVEYCLSSILFFNCANWKQDLGGTVSFVSKVGDETERESLIDIVPVQNSLSLVYHEKEVSMYTKYINNRVSRRTKPYFHCISSTFFESKRVGANDHHH